jgi:hypothetical protein
MEETMESFIEDILNNKILDEDTKLKMLKGYESQYSYLMATRVQSKEQLVKNIDNLNIIQEAIATLEEVTDD